jgi:hypothetical protein
MEQPLTYCWANIADCLQAYGIKPKVLKEAWPLVGQMYDEFPQQSGRLLAAMGQLQALLLDSEKD